MKSKCTIDLASIGPAQQCYESAKSAEYHVYSAAYARSSDVVIWINFRYSNNN